MLVCYTCSDILIWKMELGHLGDCIPFKFELVVEGLKLNFESLSMTV